MACLSVSYASPIRYVKGGEARRESLKASNFGCVQRDLTLVSSTCSSRYSCQNMFLCSRRKQGNKRGLACCTGAREAPIGRTTNSTMKVLRGWTSETPCSFFSDFVCSEPFCMCLPYECTFDQSSQSRQAHRDNIDPLYVLSPRLLYRRATPMHKRLPSLFAIFPYTLPSFQGVRQRKQVLRTFVAPCYA